ncbi:hypothetical protein SAMN05421824_0538 [Hyunsoonleella jejuensis]|uniref:Uncharacterized protein n=1 Tax=Hyunsoonleella jejuensis TaxID=419940 RepID=A0A1H9BD17_9FLAO|nr:hypothetical protein [Hyunsoonleella jejuensis]SEP86749.1 hypothetical protein SAMN05421824_0538 [Hyunsoonleella jejuensis]
MGRPTGGGGWGGGGISPLPCATHTTLINTNKIEANILLFCIIIGTQMYKKKGATKNITSKKHL